MKVCIVGGTGNISTSIVRELLRQGHDVTCYNRGKSGDVPDGARVLHGDRANRDEFERMMQKEKFDAAIDMICFNKEEALSSIRAFRGVSHFVQCSTVCTYGIHYDWLPATEDHPLRPISDYGRNKVAADNAYLEAYYRDGFPVTIVKPSTTYGPKMGVLRQIAWDFSWIDRIRKGKPIVVCGDGNAIHQFMHVDDAALCFANVLGKPHCLGQIYNMTNRWFSTWTDYHKVAMKVIGREVEIVGVPYADLETFDIPGFGICKEIFAHHIFYNSEKLFQQVPEFTPTITLEKGFKTMFEAMDRDKKIPNSDELPWEDKIIAAQRRVRTASASK